MGQGVDDPLQRPHKRRLVLRPRLTLDPLAHRVPKLLIRRVHFETPIPRGYIRGNPAGALVCGGARGRPDGGLPAGPALLPTFVYGL